MNFRELAESYKLLSGAVVLGFILGSTIVEPFLNLKTFFIEDSFGELSAGAFIVTCHNEKPAMLGVLHKKGNHIVFSPPAGKSKQGEIAERTVIRETKEETGYTINTVKFLGNSPKGNMNFSLFLSTIDQNSPAEPQLQEIIGLLWIDPHDVPEKSWRYPEQRAWVMELFEENAPRSCINII